MKNLVSVRAELKALATREAELKALETKFAKAEEIQAFVNEGIKRYGNDFIAAVSNSFQTLSGEQLKRYNLYKKLSDNGFKVSGTKVIGKSGRVYNTAMLTIRDSRTTKTASMSQQEFIKIHNRYNTK